MKDNSVSISKAIAILLMVLAHTRFLEYGNYWIDIILYCRCNCAIIIYEGS